jgi:hypothetical protein
MTARRPHPQRHWNDPEEQRKRAEAWSETNWHHDAARDGLFLVLRAGSLILGLGLACALLFDNAKPLLPVLIFLTGTGLILSWNWSGPGARD